MSLTINNQPSFQARIRLNEAEKALAATINSSGTVGTSLVTSGSVAGVASTASNIVGSGSNVLGTAFSLQASGTDSFGIVPSVLAKGAAYATPATIASAEANPSTMGSIFSTIGGMFKSLAKTESGKTKNPN